MQNNHIYIGQFIQETLRDKGVSVKWLAKKIHCHPSSIYKIFQKQYIDTQLLLDISIVLNTDFFAYYSNFIKERKSNANN